MANWATPHYPKGRVNAAGQILASEPGLPPDQLEWAFEVIGNWRSSHSRPLLTMRMALTGRARRADPNVLIAQRLKRLSSIEAKLRRNQNMKLTQMQDIGGCRAVVRNMKAVRKLLQLYHAGIAKQAQDRSECCEEYQYIDKPKNDGYRSHHFVYKYQVRADSELAVYNGLRIEVQIRSQLQHAWATAVETVGTFTEQALKSGLGSQSWKRFFALMGGALAMREHTPGVPGTPTNRAELVEELAHVTASLRAIDVLKQLGGALRVIEDAPSEAVAFLLELDSRKNVTTIRGYPAESLPLATSEYLAVEKRIGDDPSVQAVLVSVDSIASLQTAYPNYYLDTTAFLEAVKRAIGA